ncbi:hypothetical protein B296_00008522 [Ensete ventricosum]|uniref:Uncharacterized protein n=1 Tax=Ensete ventricosum TaxID=4639 RepID=A0A426Y7Y2_ENSVE|nr:hypothetical protein B296_00008522 [Ensete ventricosum]
MAQWPSTSIVFESIFVLIFAAYVMHPLRFPNSGIRAKAEREKEQWGSAHVRRRRPPARCRPRATAPVARATAHTDGVQHLPTRFLFSLNMSKFEVTLRELLNMLREAESAIKKEKPVLYIGVTQEWVDEGELPIERTKNWRWRRPYEVLAEATYGEVLRWVFRMCTSNLTSDESLGHKHMGAMYHGGRSQIASTRELIGGHSGVEAGGRKGRESDDESSGAQLPKSKVSVRKEVDSEECHSTAKADLSIAKEGMKMQGNR